MSSLENSSSSPRQVMSLKDLAEKLKTNRLKQRKTQKEVASETGLSESQIGRLEKGRSMTLPEASIVALANAYKVNKKLLLPYAKQRLDHVNKLQNSGNIMEMIKIVATSGLEKITLNDFKILLSIKETAGKKLSVQTIKQLLLDLHT